MSKRVRPHQHLLGAALWIPAAVAGLWPLIPGIAEGGGYEPLTFVDLVRLSDGVLGWVAVAGLVGLLVAVLHALSALDLWIEERALRTGGARGTGRPARLGVAAAIALGTLVGGSWTAYHHLRVDAHGNFTSLVEGWAERSIEAWRRLGTEFRRAAPPPGLATRLPAAGEDPLPLLRQLRAYAAVGVPYHVAPDGRLTLLWRDQVDRRDEPVRIDLRTWRAPAGGPTWPQMGPRPRYDPAAWRTGAIEELVERITRAHAGFRYPASWRATPGFGPVYQWHEAPAIYATGWPKEGFLGYTVDMALLVGRGSVGDRILDEVGVPGDWTVGPIEGEPYILPRPAGLAFPLAPIHLTVEADVDVAAAKGHVEGTLALLAACAVAFFAAMVESVRQFRALIAERAMSMAQSSFVSGVSHEMRTPLATVRLYAELLEQGLDRGPAQRAEFVAAILHEVDRLHRLIENVLDFARISGRKRTYAFVPTDLRALVDEAVAAASGPLAAAGLAVEVHAPAEVTAAVDRDAVVHALTNLLTNAAKYAADGGRVWVSALPGPLGATLAVQDFGPGIAREDRAAVFHPFHRLPGSAAGGSGLGLALVREYAHAHGGGVELESALGQGATFKIHLPLDPAEAPAPRRAAPWLRAVAAIRRRTAA